MVMLFAVQAVKTLYICCMHEAKFKSIFSSPQSCQSFLFESAFKNSARDK